MALGIRPKSRFIGIIMAVLVAIFVARPAVAANSDLECTFSNGQTWVYGDDGFREQSGGSLKFSIKQISEDKLTAQLVTGDRAVPVKLVRAIDAMHFLEVTIAGFLNLTTIYEDSDKNGNRPAVHSRHLGIVGKPVVSQFHGTCRTSN